MRPRPMGINYSMSWHWSRFLCNSLGFLVSHKLQRYWNLAVSLAPRLWVAAVIMYLSASDVVDSRLQKFPFFTFFIVSSISVSIFIKGNCVLSLGWFFVRNITAYRCLLSTVGLFGRVTVSSFWKSVVHAALEPTTKSSMCSIVSGF